MSAPFVQDGYYIPCDFSNPDFYLQARNATSGELLHTSPYYRVVEGRQVEARLPRLTGTDLALTTTGNELHLGEAPPHWFGSFYNATYEVRIRSAWGSYATMFVNQGADVHPYDEPPYNLYEAGSVVASGTLPAGKGSWDRPGGAQISLSSSGAYSLEITYDQYWVSEQPGRARVVADFDTRRSDKNPPELLTLNVFYEGETSSLLPPWAACEVRLRVKDWGSGLSLVSLFYQNDGDWMPLSLTSEGDEYTAQLPGFPGRSQVSLRIVAEDAAGNSLTYEVMPALLTEGLPVNGTITPSSGSALAGVTTYFTTTWTDGDGWQDLKHCYFHIGASPSLSDNVTLLYNVKEDKLWIRSDDGTQWLGGFAPGSENILANSQARVHCALTTKQGLADTLQVRWAIEFSAGYAGAKKTGLKCKDLNKAKAKGKWLGTWTISTDATITLQQGVDGYTGSEDTYIEQYAADSNYCSSSLLEVGYKQQYSAVLDFDLSSLPPNATIMQATLQVHAVGWGGSNMTIDAFRILRSTNLCQATWNQAEAGNNWGAPGCNDPVTDRSAAPESSVTTYDNHVWYGFDLTSLVQDWVDGSVANNGLLLRGASPLSGSVFYFASAQNDNVTLRPTLVITLRIDRSEDFPTLISPAAGAVMDNGRTDGLDPRVWDFDWGECAGASVYHLYVMGSRATIPLINCPVIESSYRDFCQQCWIANKNRLGWTWKVRAKVGGEWGPWSETRVFDVEPVNTDPPSLSP